MTFLAFYENQMFITMFKKEHTYLGQMNNSKNHFNIIIPAMSRSFKQFFPSSWPHEGQQIVKA
jgi:hypothetical protein